MAGKGSGEGQWGLEPGRSKARFGGKIVFAVFVQALLADGHEVLQEAIDPGEVLFHFDLQAGDGAIRQPRAVSVGFGIGVGSIHVGKETFALGLDGLAEILMALEDHGGEALLIADLEFAAHGEAHGMGHVELGVRGEPEEVALGFPKVLHVLDFLILEHLDESTLGEEFGEPVSLLGFQSSHLLACGGMGLGDAGLDGFLTGF